MIYAISPIDGRYRDITAPLADYFSEFALTKARVHSEILHFANLMSLLGKTIDVERLLKISSDFSPFDMIYIKQLEEELNHDVKAVEVYLRDILDTTDMAHLKEFIHFGLTSQDINSLAYNTLLDDYVNEKYLLDATIILKKLRTKAKEWEIPMLSRTHGQPATPTMLSKEINVFVTRLAKHLKTITKHRPAVKFSGAVGNFAALKLAYPNFDWKEEMQGFLSGLGFDMQYPTTQIENYDHMSTLFNEMIVVNTILIDMCRDIWHYISMGYFDQITTDSHVGSSTMPHKVNPIDFENAEGNLGIANALLTHFSQKLPISRLQRDLSDSTVMRNIGVAQAHTIIAFDSIITGLEKLTPNKEKIKADLEDNWQVVTEGIQTILRREGYPNPYDKLKDFSRNKKIGKKEIQEFINSLDVPNSLKMELHKITPFNYN